MRIGFAVQRGGGPLPPVDLLDFVYEDVPMAGFSRLIVYIYTRRNTRKSNQFEYDRNFFLVIRAIFRFGGYSGILEM